MYLMWQMKCCVNDNISLNISQQAVSYKYTSFLLCYYYCRFKFQNYLDYCIAPELVWSK